MIYNVHTHTDSTHLERQRGGCRAGRCVLWIVKRELEVEAGGVVEVLQHVREAYKLLGSHGTCALLYHPAHTRRHCREEERVRVPAFDVGQGACMQSNCRHVKQEV